MRFVVISFRFEGMASVEAVIFTFYVRHIFLFIAQFLIRDGWVPADSDYGSQVNTHSGYTSYMEGRVVSSAALDCGA